jgi:hypothetical protein
LACVLGSACSFTPGSIGAQPDSVQSDGWSAPVELVELSHPAGNDDPTLTGDLLEIYFGSRRPGGMGNAEDIWVATRASADMPFGAPTNVSELNSFAGETTAKVSADGLTMFLASNRASITFDLYYSTRSDRTASWSIPTWLPALSSQLDDLAAAAQPDLLRLVMCRATTAMAESIHRAERESTSAGWSAPTSIAELDAPDYNECDPMEPHALALYYASDNRSPDGSHDIYRATRADESAAWLARAPVNEINMAGFDDRDPWVSQDERTIVFSSDRNGVTSQLYMSTR